MRKVSPELAAVLAGSFSTQLLADIYHGPSERVMRDVPLSEWSSSESLGSAIKSGGSAIIVYQDPQGQSLQPEGTRGAVSAFRARVQLTMEISAGEFRELVPLGWGRIDANPHGTDTTAYADGQLIVTSSTVPIAWEGLEVILEDDNFDYPETPPQRTSCWEEVLRLTGMAVIRNVPDRPIPAETVWEAVQGGRLDAVQKLADLLGGRMIVAPSGALTIAPYAAPASPDGVLRLGEFGTITDIESAVETRGIYNRVVGIFEADDEKRSPIYATAQITTGDLSVNGHFGRRTRYYASDMVKTQVEANRAVQAVLDESIGSQTYRVSVQCVVDPRPELNDFWAVEGKNLAGRVVEIGRGGGALMNVVLEVPRVIS